jgi:hypothetical protein
MNFSEHVNVPADYLPRSDWEIVMADKQRCVKLIEDVYDLLVAGNHIEAKELIQQRVNNLTVNVPFYIDVGE